MLGNIWLSSALTVTAIFSAGAIYKSYSDIQEAKQIQEHYEIISDIKTLIAKQYNKDPNKITRDEIIAHLPKGENWEKVLLLNRDKSSNLSNKELVNQSGDFEINEDEKLKLLALKAKLKDTIDVSNITATNNKYTFEVGQQNKNSVIKDIDIEESITKSIQILSEEILYKSGADKQTVLDTVIDEFTPYDKFYFDFLKTGETSISETVLKSRQKVYFKSKIKERLYKNENALESRLYRELKDIL